MSFFKHAGRADDCCEDCKDSPCDPCGTCSESSTLDVVISGVTGCGGYTFTGFPGSYTVVWDAGLSQWYLGEGVGTYDIEGEPQGALQIVVTCIDGVYTITVDAIHTGDVFEGAGALDTVINSTNSCGVSDTIGEGGTATISE